MHLKVDNLEESFDFVNSRDKPLAAYMFTNNKQLKEKFAGSVSAGGLLVNDVALHVIILSKLCTITTIFA